MIALIKRRVRLSKMTKEQRRTFYKEEKRARNERRREKRLRWYTFPDGVWRRCDPLNLPEGARLPGESGGGGV